MKKSTLLVLICCALMMRSTNIYAQPGIEWQNTIGGNSKEFLRCIQQTADGGYILGGSSESGVSGDKTTASKSNTDYWVVKLDAAGAITWQKVIGGNNNESLFDVQQTSDGGYILGGYSASGISGDKTEAALGYYDFWVVKLDTSGAIKWQKTLGGALDDFVRSVRQTADGGYIVGGYSMTGIVGSGPAAYRVFKLDATGGVTWQKTIDGQFNDYLECIQQTTDGGYIIGGSSESGISGDKTEAALGVFDYWVVKLDTVGNITWQNTIGSTNSDYLQDVQQTADGGYILAGYSSSGIAFDKTEASQGNTDYWVVKLNAEGKITWQNTIGGSKADYLYSIQQTSDGGYILGGFTESGMSGDKTQASRGGYDYWLMKLNAGGSIIWQNTIGGSKDDRCFALQETSDKGYILSGYSDSEISGDKTEACQGDYDFWVVKLSVDQSTGIPARPANFRACRIYPNPANEKITIELYGTDFQSDLHLDIINVAGQIIRQVSIQSTVTHLELADISPGIYFYKLHDGLHTAVTGKMMIK